jgi:hypothetical protein
MFEWGFYGCYKYNYKYNGLNNTKLVILLFSRSDIWHGFCLAYLQSKGCIQSGCSKSDSVSLQFPVCGVFHSWSPSSLSKLAMVSLWFCLLPRPYILKFPCNYIGFICKIQDNLPISWSLTYLYAKSYFPCKYHRFRGSGELNVNILRGVPQLLLNFSDFFLSALLSRIYYFTGTRKT